MNPNQKRLLAANIITNSYRISYLANFLQGPVYDEIAAQSNMARSEFVIVFCLKHLGELSAQDICDCTGRPKNSVSQAVTKLVKANRILRQPDPNDARRATLTLTALGQSLYDQLIPLFVSRERAMFSVLSKSELKQLDGLLQKLTLRTDGWACS